MILMLVFNFEPAITLRSSRFPDELRTEIRLIGAKLYSYVCVIFVLFIAIVYNVIDLIRINADIERKLHELNSNYNCVTWSLFFITGDDSNLLIGIK